MTFTSTKHIIAIAACVPLRRMDSDAVEMVSQMLLGETATVLEARERWLRVKMDFDGYIGWVGVSQVMPIGPEARAEWLNSGKVRRSPWRSFRIRSEDGNYSVLPVGGLCEPLEDGRIRFPFGHFEPVDGRIPLAGNTVFETANGFLGTPYLWGGRTDSGLDCSGLVQTALCIHGIKFPRDSTEQAEHLPCAPVDFDRMEPGDILYFKNPQGRVFHTGFYYGDGLLLHASGSVKLENIDPRKRQHGVFPFNERLAGSVSGYQKTELAGPAHQTEGKEDGHA